MLKKDCSKPFSVIISITFIITCLLASVHFWCFNESFYKYEHDHLTLYGKSISDHIGISDEQLSDLTHFTLSYLNDPDASLDIQMEVNGVTREIFTDDEKAHMVDVRKLNLAANYILIGSCTIFLTLFVLYVINQYSFVLLFNQYKKVLLYALVIFGLIGFWIVIDFDSFWTNFHHLFFAGNSLWILDLKKDILIMIVPPEFFNHLVLMIFVCFMLQIVGIYFFLKHNSKKKVIVHD